MTRISCFKAYDIRGKVGIELDPDFAFRLGRAIALRLNPGTVVIGHDARASSPDLAAALAHGLTIEGVQVRDLGLCGTEEVYFGTDHVGAGAGVMVTASHNPIEYNGFKLIGPGARPLTDGEFREIEHLVAAPRSTDDDRRAGHIEPTNLRAAYVDRVLSFIDCTALAPMRLVANAGNGAAGPTFDAIAEALAARGAKLDICRVNHTPDCSFPNGIPNPLLPENHAATGDAVRASWADFGVAWDGDFDRCFFFDETGAAVPGEYVVGLLARSMLERDAASQIVHDPRVVWNTQSIVAARGGQAVVAPVGHVFMKNQMRRSNASYGGEMSAHHYFRDFMYCDSGMIPLLLILDLLSRTGRTLGQEVAEMRREHPSSGEINFRVADSARIVADIRALYAERAVAVDDLDGLSLEFPDWRFNLRRSNTEPLLRLNIETAGSAEQLGIRKQELSDLIHSAG
ncbi:MAG: phosphomannomutase [Tabrizicola sp.]|jgi:phosphomannomutase|nr:phosphomannomutase [Tabrizicola sp.]